MRGISRSRTGGDRKGYLVEVEVPRLAGSYSPSNSMGGEPGVWDRAAGPVGSTNTSSARVIVRTVRVEYEWEVEMSQGVVEGVGVGVGKWTSEEGKKEQNTRESSM
jgi:hypothetical protein